MTEFLVSSTALITLLIILRFIFSGRISRRLQYTLWGLVLLRLLLPISLFNSPLSIMNLINSSKVQRPLSSAQVYSDAIGNTNMTPAEARKNENTTLQEIQTYPAGTEKSNLGNYNFTDSLDTVLAPTLKFIWLCGSAAAGLWFLCTNIVFYLKLRKTRRRFNNSDSVLLVYINDYIASPCLYGLFRPAIYLTPKAIESEARKDFVIAHELCHYRHLDHVWSLMRGLCLVAYWWNPFVWAAAVLSRSDGEMACDEAVLKKFGEKSRFDYGRALIDMVAVKKMPTGLMCAATTMISGKHGIKARLDMIIKSPKTYIPALAAFLLAAAIMVGCTFTGAEAKNYSAEEALGKLMSSISHSDNQVSFKIPENYKNAKDWNIIISGRMESDGQSQSLHYYSDINEKKGWEPGKVYTISFGNNAKYLELIMHASLTSENGGVIEKEASLLPQKSYSIRRIGAIGNVLFVSGDSAKLTEKLIYDYMLKSAAWPPIDVNSADECFVIEAKSSVEKSNEYYAFMVEGKAYMQIGKNGHRSRLSDELYSSFRAMALSGLTGGSVQERFALDYIDNVIKSFKSMGVIIKDSKITSLKKAARFENMAEYPIELWLLEYRLLPEDMSKVIFAGGMTQENGTITEYSSMGQPYLIIAYKNGAATYIGNTWTGSVSEEGGMENGLRMWLENNRLIKPETYSSAHYTVTFNLSDGSESKLILSQPAKRDSSGIWCVERWYDSNGGMYLVSPDNKENAPEYYSKLQSESDRGSRPGLLDPKQVALEYLNGRLGQRVSIDSLKSSEKYTGVDTNVVIWNLLNVICSSPAAASNPQAYIEAHKEDYNVLINSWDLTLRYVYSEFLKGGQTGLRGHIMLSIMREILMDEVPEIGQYSTGQDGFDNFKSWAIKNKAEIEKSKPRTAILFELLK